MLKQIRAPDGSTKTERIPSRTLYYRFRRAQDGFFKASGGDLASVSNFVIGSQTGAFGVYSNRVYWQYSNQTLAEDTSKLDDLKSQGETWTNLADGAQMNVRTLGILARPDSFVWNGMDFTAEASEDAYPVAPKDRNGRRILSGHLFTSNDLPSMIDYQSLSTRFEVHFTYKDPVMKERLGIPSQIFSVMKFPSGGTNSRAIEIILFQLSDLPPGSTGPMDFKNANPTKMLVALRADGTGTMTSVATGKTFPMNTSTNGKSKFGLVARIVIISAFVASFFVFLIFLRRTPESS